MRIGITGGTGSLGSRLARRLAARGDAVTVFSRHPERYTARSSPIRYEHWQSGVEPPPAAVVEMLDAVVNLAGENLFGLWTDDRKQRIAASRVRVTEHVVTGIRDANQRPAVLLSGSASGFYGSRGDEELTEDSGSGSGFLARLCESWEAEARAAEELGVRVVLLRTAPVLVSGEGFLKPLVPLFKLGLGGKLGDGRQWLCWIHVEDWVELVLMALDREAVRGPLNMATPNPVRNETFTRELASALGRPAVFRVPAFAMKLAMGQMAEETALVSQRLVPMKALGLGFAFRFPELGPALRDLLSK
jgi:uncharacterized protein (TIGR01777 family)